MFILWRLLTSYRFTFSNIIYLVFIYIFWHFVLWVLVDIFVLLAELEIVGWVGFAPQMGLEC